MNIITLIIYKKGNLTFSIPKSKNGIKSILSKRNSVDKNLIVNMFFNLYVNMVYNDSKKKDHLL